MATISPISTHLKETLNPASNPLKTGACKVEEVAMGQFLRFSKIINEYRGEFDLNGVRIDYANEKIMGEILNGKIENDPFENDPLEEEFEPLKESSDLEYILEPVVKEYKLEKHYEEKVIKALQKVVKNMYSRKKKIYQERGKEFTGHIVKAEIQFGSVTEPSQGGNRTSECCFLEVIFSDFLSTDDQKMVQKLRLSESTYVQLQGKRDFGIEQQDGVIFCSSSSSEEDSMGDSEVSEDSESEVSNDSDEEYFSANEGNAEYELSNQ